MNYASVKLLYTFINWGVLLISSGGTLACLKIIVEAKIYGDSWGDVSRKIMKKLIACVVAVIGATYVGFVKGYFLMERKKKKLYKPQNVPEKKIRYKGIY